MVHALCGLNEVTTKRPCKYEIIPASSDQPRRLDIVGRRGFQPLCPMSASRATVFLFLGYLQDKYKVRAASLQPYMSGINQAHIDFGFPAPAMGHDVHPACKGFSEVEVAHTLKSAVRSPLPTRVAYEITVTFHPQLTQMRMFVCCLCFVRQGRHRYPYAMCTRHPSDR